MSTRKVFQLIAGTLAVAVVTAILFPVFAKAKEGSRRSCSSYLRELGVAMKIYAHDNNDRLPPAQWTSAIQSALGRQSYAGSRLFTCRSLVEQRKEWGFAMNIEYVGAKLHAIKEPDKAILLFETDALAKDVVANLAARSQRRHGQGSVVVFANGKVKRLVDEQEP